MTGQIVNVDIDKITEASGNQNASADEGKRLKTIGPIMALESLVPMLRKALPSFVG
jgi:hypothetical protein